MRLKNKCQLAVLLFVSIVSSQASCGSEHHESDPNVGGGGHVGDDHGDELRNDAGHERGDV